MTTWSGGRLRVAALAILSAALTGAAGAALGGSSWQLYGGAAYLTIALAALFHPPAIALQMIAGQLLVGSVLLAPDGPAPVMVLPVVAAVVLTAELLGVVARLDTPLERDPRDDLRRAGTAALIGGGVFGAVALLGGLPGPSGLVAIMLAAAGCVVSAILLVSNAQQSS